MKEENMAELVAGMCKWLKEVKGITEIDVIEMAKMLPEYEKYLADNEKP